MIHQLKTEKEYFEAVLDGKKQFEVRREDRGFTVGDLLALNETEEGKETGRCCLVSVVYVLNDKRFVREGYVVLGTRKCVVGRADDERYLMDVGEYYRVKPIDNEKTKTIGKGR